VPLVSTARFFVEGCCMLWALSVACLAAARVEWWWVEDALCLVVAESQESGDVVSTATVVWLSSPQSSFSEGM